MLSVFQVHLIYCLIRRECNATVPIAAERIEILSLSCRHQRDLRGAFIAGVVVGVFSVAFAPGAML